MQELINGLFETVKQAETFALTSPAEKNMAGQFKTAKDAVTYIFAGNAYITLRSLKTGTRFTYRISRAKNALDETGVHFVKVLTGPDNENDYRYVGYLKNKEFFFGGAKAKITRNAPSVIAFEWAMNALTHNMLPVNLVEIWHDGRCGRCGRKLTVPESVERGIGPECASIMGIE